MPSKPNKIGATIVAILILILVVGAVILSDNKSGKPTHKSPFFVPPKGQIWHCDVDVNTGHYNCTIAGDNENMFWWAAIGWSYSVGNELVYPDGSKLEVPKNCDVIGVGGFYPNAVGCRR